MRKPISKRERFEVFKRDLFTCRYCGRKPPDVVLHVDHVIPVALGGPNEITNYVTSCVECNIGKSARPLDSVVPNAVEMERARVEQINAQRDAVKAREEAIKSQRKEVLDRAREVWSSWVKKCMSIEGTLGPEYLEEEAVKNIIRFSEDLPVSEMLDAVERAFRKFPDPSDSDYKFHGRMRYFYGVCWRKIKGDYAEHMIRHPTTPLCT